MIPGPHPVDQAELRRLLKLAEEQFNRAARHLRITASTLANGEMTESERNSRLAAAVRAGDAGAWHVKLARDYAEGRIKNPDGEMPKKESHR